MPPRQANPPEYELDVDKVAAEINVNLLAARLQMAQIQQEQEDSDIQPVPIPPFVTEEHRARWGTVIPADEDGWIRPLSDAFCENLTAVGELMLEIVLVCVTMVFEVLLKFTGFGQHIADELRSDDWCGRLRWLGRSVWPLFSGLAMVTRVPGMTLLVFLLWCRERSDGWFAAMLRANALWHVAEECERSSLHRLLARISES